MYTRQFAHAHHRKHRLLLSCTNIRLSLGERGYISRSACFLLRTDATLGNFAEPPFAGQLARVRSPIAGSPHAIFSRYQRRISAAKSAKLDRFKAFRKRQEAPGSLNVEPRSPRTLSPGWLQKMQRSSSSKRPRSPSVQPQPAVGTHQPDPHNQQGQSRDEGSMEPPKMPAFLQQTPMQIQAKFHELIWIERARIAKGNAETSPDEQWGRCEGPHIKPLDRYPNIYPWKSNRVRLRVPEDKNDYINASPIVLQSPKTNKENKHIAMQGPKEGSTSHVWRMLWDELSSPAVIVMLTQTHEGNMEKCFQYFPQTVDSPPLVINEQDEFGDGFKASVSCVTVESTDGAATQVRKLVMKVVGKEEEKVIWHLLYTGWPDFGVPAAEDLDGFFKLMELSKSKNNGPENPRIVHCSAGVGRSGTFIALEYLMQELDAGALEQDQIGDEAEDPVFETVNNLRIQRLSMVQAESQYHFIYQVLRQRWEANHAAVLHSGAKAPAAKMAKINNADDVFRS